MSERLRILTERYGGGRPVDAPPETITTLGLLLDATERFICRFIGFKSKHEPAAVALWCAHCYAVRSAAIAAYLRVRSSAEESGKTTFLEVVELILRDHAINAVSASPSAIYRLRDKVGPVALLLDETDNGLAKRKDDGARDLLSIVNAGYRHSAKVIRSEGRTFEPRVFRAFGPAAIAGIGYLEPTTESRCIPIVLPRKKRGSLERFISFLVEEDANAIADGFEAWATDDVLASLRTHRPEFPSELRDRHVEVWWNLFAIADMAGGSWPARAREAALALHVGQEDSSALSLGVLLLSHIHRAFEDVDADRMASSQILRALIVNEEGPWAKWWSAEIARADRDDESPRVAAADLARHLKGFEKADGSPIKPHVIKMPDGSTARGYNRVDFEGAWETYLGFGSPDVTDVTNVTPLASTVTSVTSVTSPHPNGHAACPKCEALIQPAADECWRCGTARPADVVADEPDVFAVLDESFSEEGDP